MLKKWKIMFDPSFQTFSSAAQQCPTRTTTKENTHTKRMFYKMNRENHLHLESLFTAKHSYMYTWAYKHNMNDYLNSI